MVTPVSVWSEVEVICIWPSWCHCHPIVSCFIKTQIGLSFLMWAAQVVLEKKRPLNMSVCLQLPCQWHLFEAWFCLVSLSVISDQNGIKVLVNITCCTPGISWLLWFPDRFWGHKMPGDSSECSSGKVFSHDVLSNLMTRQNHCMNIDH